MNSIDIFAQFSLDMTLDNDFAAQVKSIDEFIQRFNGEESHPEINDSNRIHNLTALFDYKMSHEGMTDSLFKQKIWDFVHQVNETNYKIKLTDSDFYADAEITASLSGRLVPLSIVLQSQVYCNNRVRWAIVGVRGIEEAKLIDFVHFYGISPVDHETHFMSLSDIFSNNAPEIMGYRGKHTKIDNLSVFLTLAMMDNVRIIGVNKLTMHCLDIPNYIFTINEIARSGTNSGWLISSITKLSENKKEEYIIKLLGK